VDGGADQQVAYTNPATGGYRVNLPQDASYTLSVTPLSPGYTTPAAQRIAVAERGLRLTFPLAPAATCTAPGYQAKFSGPVQHFDTPQRPGGWKVRNVDLGYPGYAYTPGWVFDNPGHRANRTGGTGNFAIVDSGHSGQHAYQDTYLYTPVASLKGAHSPVVEFASDFEPTVNSSATVGLSTDGGKTWRTIWANSGVPGTALVTDTSHPGRHATTGPLAGAPALGGGYYWLFIPAGSQTFTTILTGYAQRSATATITGNKTNILNFTLTAS
jgi:hypothetical protein